jgi:hypothetical protein
MRRLALRLTALALLAGALLPPPALAQAAGKKAPAAAAAQGAANRGTPSQGAPGQPPHAWLFGTWTGGIFPPPSQVTAEACMSQPVVIFTRDVVLRATLTDQFYIQRLVATALTTAHGTQFQFAGAAPSMSLLGPAAATAPGMGFGCESPDVLDVERRTDNQITFPGCSDFPYPLIRCPGR